MHAVSWRSVKAMFLQEERCQSEPRGENGLLRSAVRRIDDAVLAYIQTNLRFWALDRAMPLLSRSGNGGAVWMVIAGLLLVSQRQRGAGFLMLLSLAICGFLTNLALKPLVSRRRPCAMAPDIAMLIPRPKDFSFPSGHTMSSFAAASVLCMADPAWGWMGLGLALLIAFSRLYLYVHYFSDVMAGMMLGVFVAVASARLAPFVI